MRPIALPVSAIARSTAALEKIYETFREISLELDGSKVEDVSEEQAKEVGYKLMDAYAFMLTVIWTSPDLLYHDTLDMQEFALTLLKEKKPPFNPKRN